MCAWAVSPSSGVRILPETLPSLEWSRKEHPLSLAPQSRVGQAGGFVRDQKKKSCWVWVRPGEPGSDSSPLRDLAVLPSPLLGTAPLQKSCAANFVLRLRSDRERRQSCSS